MSTPSGSKRACAGRKTAANVDTEEGAAKRRKTEGVSHVPVVPAAKDDRKEGEENLPQVQSSTQKEDAASTSTSTKSKPQALLVVSMKDLRPKLSAAQALEAKRKRELESTVSFSPQYLAGIVAAMERADKRFKSDGASTSEKMPPQKNEELEDGGSTAGTSSVVLAPIGAGTETRKTVKPSSIHAQMIKNLEEEEKRMEPIHAENMRIHQAKKREEDLRRAREERERNKAIEKVSARISEAGGTPRRIGAYSWTILKNLEKQEQQMKEKLARTSASRRQMPSTSGTVMPTSSNAQPATSMPTPSAPKSKRATAKDEKP